MEPKAKDSSPEPMATPPTNSAPEPGQRTESPPPDTKPAAAPSKPPKTPGNGVTAAIVATVIIVIVLAGLAVFAYLKK